MEELRYIIELAAVVFTIIGACATGVVVALFTTRKMRK